MRRRLNAGGPPAGSFDRLDDERAEVRLRSRVVPERLDRVTVATGGRDVVLTWASREALLERLRNVESMRAVVEAFEAVGASRPVELPHGLKRQLIQELERWSEQTPAGAFPPGLWDLRHALLDDLKAAG